MPTTAYTDSTFGVNTIGARTDNAGAAVDDLSAEEFRLMLTSLFSEGVVEPGGSGVADQWQVHQREAGANMSVDIGSGTAKADYAVVRGRVAGQGHYLVRKESALINVVVPAAHVSLARTDEVYLVVADAPYDAGSVSLPRIGYRQGDAGGGAPGPDAAWDAYLLLATISVPANDTAITDAQITDGRVFATAVLPLAADSVTPEQIDTLGGLVSDAMKVGYFEEHVADVTLTTSYETGATGTFTKPAEWATYDILMWGSVTFYATAVGGGIAEATMQAGTNGPELQGGVGQTGVSINCPIMHSRTGQTGNLTLNARYRLVSGDVNKAKSEVHYIAVRTS